MRQPSAGHQRSDVTADLGQSRSIGLDRPQRLFQLEKFRREEDPRSIRRPTSQRGRSSSEAERSAFGVGLDALVELVADDRLVAHHPCIVTWFDDVGITRFGELLLAHKALHYPDHEIGGAWGDPHGTARGPDEEQVFDILNLVTDWGFRPAPTNLIELRLEAVKLPLNRMIDGLPAVQVSPTCVVLRKGFVSGYHYKLVRSSNGASVHQTPDKNAFSHVHDACQYLCLGGGEYQAVLGKAQKNNAPRVLMAQGVGEDPFSQGTQNPSGTPYMNEKTMREWRDNRGKPKQTLALGVDDDVY